MRLNCRGGSRAEAVAYAAGLALWQRRLAANVDAFVVPSAFALRRLRELGAPVGDRAHVVGSVQRDIADRSRAAEGRFVLAAGRLTPEKGFADAIDAARLAGLPLVIAGDGPEATGLRVRAGGADVRFTGVLGAAELADLRRDAAAAVVPSRFAEILPLAALEAMAAGLPLAAADAGGLTEAVPDEGRYPPGDAVALAERLTRLWRSAEAGERGLAVVRERYAPEAVAARLRGLYADRDSAFRRGVVIRMRRAPPSSPVRSPSSRSLRRRHGAATSLKKGIWGPVRLDGVSQFPDLPASSAPASTTSASMVASGDTAARSNARDPRRPGLRLAGPDRRRRGRGGELAASASR